MYREKILNRLPLFTLILFIIQPLMDVFSYVSDKLVISNIFSLVLRFAVLLVVLLIGFIISNNKKIYIFSASAMLIYTVCHICACVKSGYNDPVGDIANLIRIYQMPLFTICFITFVKANKKVFKSIKYGFVICLTIIAAVEIISVITQTNPYTYENKSIGIIGWFYDSSAQSAVLCTIIPVYCAWATQKFKNNLPLLIISLLFSTLILFMYATRLAYITLLITLFGIAVTLIITHKNVLKQTVSIIMILILFFCIIPFSPMAKNQNMVDDNAIKKQDHIDSLVSGSSTEDLREAYEYYMGGLVGRFGLDEVAKEYNYSTKASDICDVRRMKNTYCSLLMKEQGISATLFGMELSDMTYDGWIHDVENDFHGIYYLTGFSGLLMMIIFIGYFVFLILKSLITDFKATFNLESAGFGIAFIACMLHAYATCGVLRRPGSSFYLSAIFASVFFITKLKKGYLNDHNN